MKILVPVKRVIDPYVRVRVKSDDSGVETAGVKMDINPFCEIAVEEALRLKEKGVADEVVVVSIGPQAAQEQLRKSLAMGADRAILVQTDDELQPLTIAKTLQKIVEKEQPGLVIGGKQSIDGDNNQTGQMLAAMLGWGQGTFVSALEIAGEMANITREVDGGLEKLKVKLPCVLTTDLRLNEPRNVTLPNVMKAKQKPLETMALADLGIESKTHMTTLKVTEPPVRAAGVKVESVAELVDKLKNEAGVI